MPLPCCQSVGVMQHPSRPANAPRPPIVRGPVRLALAVTSLLATFGSFAVSFGGLTECTNEYRCTVTDCTPCATADDWFTAGWAGQVLLLLATGVLVLLAAGRVRPRAVRGAALGLTVISPALFVVTTALAQQSF
jgi:hypothetical protein